MVVATTTMKAATAALVVAFVFAMLQFELISFEFQLDMKKSLHWHDRRTMLNHRILDACPNHILTRRAHIEAHTPKKKLNNANEQLVNHRTTN